MGIKVDSRPRAMEETAYMLYHYANNLSYTEVYKRLTARYGRKQNETIRERLYAHAIKLDEIMQRVCEGLDRGNGILQKYFKDLGYNERDQSFLFRICMEQFSTPIYLSMDEYAKIMLNTWEYYKQNGIRINKDGDEWRFSKGDKPLSDEILISEISSLPYPKEICMQLCILFMNFEENVNSVVEFMRPYAEKLIKELEGTTEVRLYVAELWQKELSVIGVEEYLRSHGCVCIDETDKETTLFVNSMLPNMLVYCPAGDLPESAQSRSLSVGIGMLPEYEIVGINKSIESLSEVIRIMSDKTKFKILCKLREKSYYCHELAAEMGLNSGHMSRTLTSLYYAGLLNLEQSGGRTYYSLNRDNIAIVCDSLRDYFMMAQE